MSQNIVHKTESTEHAHPSDRTYVGVAIVLAIITSIEVAVYYIPELRPVMVWILFALSAAKFALVAALFMHLRFDSKLFVAFFGGGLTLAACVAASFMLLMHSGGGYVAPPKPPAVEAPATEGGAEPAH